MTVPELFRMLADETEKRQAAEAEIERLRAELEEARAAVQKVVPSQMFDTSGAALYLGISPSFLEKDRMNNPPRISYVKVSPRAIRYAKADLDAYKDNRKKRAA